MSFTPHGSFQVSSPAQITCIESVRSGLQSQNIGMIGFAASDHLEGGTGRN